MLRQHQASSLFLNANVLAEIAAFLSGEDIINIDGVLKGLLVVETAVANVSHTADFWRRLTVTLALPCPDPQSPAREIAMQYASLFTTGEWVVDGPTAELVEARGNRVTCLLGKYATVPVRWNQPVPAEGKSYWVFDICHKYSSSCVLFFGVGALSPQMTHGSGGGGPASPRCFGLYPCMLASWKYAGPFVVAIPEVGAGDRIGMLVDADVNTLRFMVNGKDCGAMFGEGGLGPAWLDSNVSPLHPVVVMNHAGDSVALSRKPLCELLLLEE